LGETSQRATDFISDADAEPCPARVLAVTDDSADRSVWKPFASEGPHGHRDRMHDRLLERGADGLADYELVEMLLFFAQAKGDTKPVAKRLINRFGSYSSVLCATPKDLQKVQGVDRHSIAAIKLAHAGAVRLARAQLLNRTILGNWDRLIDYLMAAMARERIEQFRILFLDAKNELIADEVHGRGTINHTPVYPREVARRALELYAAALIFVHNHPSGDPTPSMADIEMTEQMQRVLQSLGISLHDHIIVGDGRWTSLKKEGFIS
jgi:DNA repair protein RadC